MLLSPFSFINLLILSCFKEFVFHLPSSCVFWWAAQAEMHLFLFWTFNLDFYSFSCSLQSAILWTFLYKNVPQYVFSCVDPS